MDHEAWRPALIAFYKADCWFQSAENLERGYDFCPQDHSVIRALQAAFAVAPREEMRRAA